MVSSYKQSIAFQPQSSMVQIHKGIIKFIPISKQFQDVEQKHTCGKPKTITPKHIHMKLSVSSFTITSVSHDIIHMTMEHL